MTTTTETTTVTTTLTSTSGTMASSGNIVIGLDSLSTYDGTTPVDEFLTVLEGTGALAKWTDDQLIAIALLKLRGRAKQFLDSEPTLRTTTSWRTLKEQLRSQFRRQYIKGSAVKNFIECRQRTNETCRQYLTRLKLLGNRTIELTGDQNKDEILTRKLEEDITTQFTLGLVMPLKQRVLSGDPQSLEDALKIAEREESIENLVHPSSSKECRVVSKPSTSYYKPNKEIKSAAKYKCIRCQKEGHTVNFCKEKDRRSCFICHEKGHISSVCPNKVKQERRELKNDKCFYCQQPGHFSRYCPTRYRKPFHSTAQQTALNSNAAEFQPRTPAVEEASWN